MSIATLVLATVLKCAGIFDFTRSIETIPELPLLKFDAISYRDFPKHYRDFWWKILHTIVQSLQRDGFDMPYCRCLWLWAVNEFWSKIIN